MAVEIRAPICVIGSPRSGTGSLAWRIREHPDLASMTNITQKVPSSLWITRLIMMFRHDQDPSEGHKTWEKFLCHDDDSLTREDVTPRARRYIRKVVSNTLKVFKRPRFIMKCPANSVRMGFLEEILPDMIFIHMIRDGRAVASSIMRKRQGRNLPHWGCRPPGWRDLLDLPLVEACGMQWKMIVEHVLEHAKRLPEERYMEVRYEQYMERPEETLRAVGDRCGLAWDPQHLKQVAAGLENRNYKWREGFTPQDIETLNSLLGDLLTRLGYDIAS